jgi:hypothetical protein
LPGTTLISFKKNTPSVFLKIINIPFFTLSIFCRIGSHVFDSGVQMPVFPLERLICSKAPCCGVPTNHGISSFQLLVRQRIFQSCIPTMASKAETDETQLPSAPLVAILLLADVHFHSLYKFSFFASVKILMPF